MNRTRIKGIISNLYERHKNPLSWLMRPLFGAVWFYGAWLNNWTVLIIGILGVSTSWFWFPKPKKNYPWVEKFIDIEMNYITPPWTLKKVIPLIFVFLFLVVVTLAFGYRNVRLGLIIFILGALYKSIWSLIVAKQSGIPAAIIGILSALVAAIILYYVL